MAKKTTVSSKKNGNGLERKGQEKGAKVSLCRKVINKTNVHESFDSIKMSPDKF